MALLTIHFGKTRKVPQDFLSTAKIAVDEMLRFLSIRHRPRIKDLSNWGNTDIKKPYASWGWYQSSSLLGRRSEYGQQVDADTIAYKLQFGPDQKDKPHINIVLFNRDLTAKSNGQYLNFIFGMGSPTLGLILSVARFCPINNKRLQQLAFRRIVQHEFGHLLGLVHRHHNCGTSGIYENHCAGQQGPCAMRQILSIDELIKLSIEEQKAGVILCPDCRDELKSYFP